jgi:hypothetical protein
LVGRGCRVIGEQWVERGCVARFEDDERIRIAGGAGCAAPEDRDEGRESERSAGAQRRYPTVTSTMPSALI